MHKLVWNAKRTCCLLFVACALPAVGQKYTTQSFDTQISIRKDRMLDVTETIAVTYLVPQHGLLRTIPVRYEGTKGVRFVRLSSESAEMDSGSGFKPTPLDVSGSDVQTLRVGDPAETHTGPAKIRLHYTIEGAITDFDASAAGGAHSELYWNVIPAGWATPIDHASVGVQYPRATGTPLMARIFIGPAGSSEHVDVLPGAGPASGAPLDASLTDTKLDAQSKGALNFEGITVVLGLPIGTLAPPVPGSDGSFMEPPGLALSPALLLLPVLLPIGYLIIYRKQWKGSVPKTPVAFEPPADLGPLESAALLTGTLHPRDFVAEVVSLSQRKVCRLIHRADNQSFDIQLLAPADVKVDVYGKSLLESDLELYAALQGFGNPIVPESLGTAFARRFIALTSSMKGRLVSIGRTFAAGDTRLGLGVAFICLLVMWTLFIGSHFDGAGMLVALLVLVFQIVAIKMATNLTRQGQTDRNQLMGLKEFITRSYQRELNYWAHTDFDQALYEKLLPYAIQFDAVKQWTKAFEGVSLQPPDWFVGCDPNTYWYDQLMFDSMGFQSTASSAFTSPSSGSGFASDSGFSGGGDVGGGGGGGGGDSW